MSHDPKKWNNKKGEFDNSIRKNNSINKLQEIKQYINCKEP